MTSRRSSFTAPLLALVLFTLAGCSAATEPSPTLAKGEEEFLTEGSAFAEYETTIRSIDELLPEGRAYPPGLPANFLPNDGVLMEGAARNVAYFTWLCAWESEYLDAFTADDEERLTQAESMITAWETLDFYTTVIVDPERGWVSNVLRPMELGDPSGVKADHTALCHMYPTVESQ